MTISLLNAKGEVVKSYQKTDLKLKRNTTVNTSITLDGTEIKDEGSGNTGNLGITLDFDPEWETIEEVVFH